MGELVKYRKEIDNIDAQLVDLFERRMELSLEIALHKIASGESIFNAQREKEVFHKVQHDLKNLELSRELREFFTVIMELSKEVQTREFAKHGIYGCEWKDE